MPGIKEQMKASWVIDTAAGGVVELAYNAKRSLLAMATADGPIMIINTETRSQAVLSGHTLGCSSVCWSPDGDLLVSIGQDGRLRWWDADSLKQIMDIPSAASWGVKVAFSPDGQYLASAAGKKLIVWDARGQMVCQYPDHASTIAGMAWRPGLSQIVTCCYGVINFWEINRQVPKRTFPWKGSMLTMVLSPDGKYVTTGDQDASVHFWYIKSGRDLMMSGYQAKVRELSWSTDSRYLATGGALDTIVWDTSGKGPAGSKPLTFTGSNKDLISALAFAPQGYVLAVGSKDGFLFIWDAANVDRLLGLVSLKEEISHLTWLGQDVLMAVSASGVVSKFQPLEK